jgi:hypothetical protein
MESVRRQGGHRKAADLQASPASSDPPLGRIPAPGSNPLAVANEPLNLRSRPPPWCGLRSHVAEGRQFSFDLVENPLLVDVAHHVPEQLLRTLPAVTVKRLQDSPTEPRNARAGQGSDPHAPRHLVVSCVRQVRLLSATRSWSWPASRHSSSAAMSSRLPSSSGETLAVGRQGTETRFGASEGILMEIAGSQSTNRRAGQGFLLERYSMAKPRRPRTGGQT